MAKIPVFGGVGRIGTLSAMTNEPMDEIPKFIRRLMSTSSEEELREATETFKQYMAIVRRIYERITSEKIELDSSDRQRCDRVRDIDPNV